MKIFTKEEVIKLIKSLDSSYGSCDEDSRINSAWYSGFNATQESMISAIEEEDKKPIETFSGVTVSPESTYLFTEAQFIRLLQSKGVDTTRKIKINERGGVYYVD